MKNTIIRIITTLVLAIMTPTTVYAGTPAEEAQKAVTIINDYRAANGLTVLTVDDRLSNATAIRAEECSRLFSHTRPDGTAWYTADSDLLYGENCAKAFYTAESVVKAWIESPTHLMNITDKDFTSCNIQIYVADNGTWYWVNEFGY